MDLTGELNRYIGTTTGIERTAVALRRLAKQYNRIQERWSSEEMDRATVTRLEGREAALEATIADLVGDLPQPDDGPWRVRFEGDPRGWTVRLIAPDDHEIGLDT